MQELKAHRHVAHHPTRVHRHHHAAGPLPKHSVPSGDTFVPSGGGIVAPIPGWQNHVTSHFGHRHNAMGGKGSEFHPGVDIGAPTGTPIRAARAGVVVFAGAAGGYGNLTAIKHADGSFTMYGHQSHLGVHVGQQVAAGQTIGRVGRTGRATGPHLHFEVRKGGATWNTAHPVDSMPTLRASR